MYNNPIKKMAINKRTQKDINDILKSDNPLFKASVDPDNLNHIHFIIHNLDGLYKNGCYHCLIVLPPEYPFKAPNFYMLSESGRFKVDTLNSINKNKGICFTYSSWHQESWSSIINIETMIKGFISFFLDDKETVHEGYLKTSDEKKIEIAQKSKDILKNDELYKKLFD